MKSGKILVGPAAALAVVAAWLFLWHVGQTPGGGRLGFNYDRGLQDLQAHAFVNGRLDLHLEPPPPELQLKDYRKPEIYAKYHYLWDTSPYRGKVYLYFGPGPLLTFHIPYYLLAGVYPAAGLAIFCFLAGSLLVLALVLKRFYRAASIEPGFWDVVPALALMGFGTMTAVLVHRPFIYELSIASALFWTSVSAYFVFDALQARGDRQVLSFLLGATAFGFAIASRASYLYGAIFLIAALTRTYRRDRQAQVAIASGIAIALPLALTGLALAAYNFARFGDPLEFGWHYQVGWDAVPMFSAGNVAPNLYFYVAHPLHVDPASLSVSFNTNYPAYLAPPYSREVYESAGFAINFPALTMALAIGGALLVSERSKAPRRAVEDLAVVALPGVVNFMMLLFYPHLSVRYLADFLPAFGLIGAAGWVLFEERMRTESRLLRILFRTLFVICLVATALVHAGISLAYEG